MALLYELKRYDLTTLLLFSGEIPSWFPIRSGQIYLVNNAKNYVKETTPEFDLSDM